jgi:hypothetical protein
MIRTILKRTLPVVILMVGFVIATRSGSLKLRAEEPQQSHACTAATLHGRYGSASSGLINNSSNPNDITVPAFVPFAEAAFFDFDAHGNISGASTPNFGGQIDPSATPIPATGSYTVDSSTCTGTLTINVSGGPSFHRNLIILDNAREIGFVSTDPGLVIAGSFKKQFSSTEEQ